jgi:hypothetical protein
VLSFDENVVILAALSAGAVEHPGVGKNLSRPSNLTLLRLAEP